MADKTQALGPNLVKQVVIDLIVALLLCILVARIGVGRKRDTAIKFALAGIVIAWLYKREARGEAVVGGTPGVR